MVSFSPCKINIGLNIINKRNDGFHNLETIFYPVYFLHDIIEIVIADNDEDQFVFTGLKIEGDFEHNLCNKTIKVLHKKYNFPNVSVYLHKIVPMGAGLGGGSANVATIINLVDKLFNLAIDVEEKKEIASILGSDCAFFINPQVSIGTEKGNILNPINLILKDYYLLIVQPPVHVSTAEAYSLIKPDSSKPKLFDLISAPIEGWKDIITNDFEESVFSMYPIVGVIKKQLYNSGAIYAQMSGSGSSVFGLFSKKPNIEFSSDFFVTGGFLE